VPYTERSERSTRPRHVALTARAAAVVGVALALGWPGEASAYVWMIQHGYAACGACHADPSGGSLLTRYGRAQGELLLKTRYQKVPEDQEQEPGRVGDFLFGAFKLPDRLLLGGDVRLMYLAIKPEKSPWTYVSNFGRSGKTPWYGSWLAMQQDVVGQLTVSRVRGFVSLGYARDTAKGSYDGDALAAITRTTPDRFVSRAYWLGVDLGAENQWLVRAGRFNLPYGLRLVEHPMWVRNVTRTDIDAFQQDGVSVSYTSPKLRGEAMVILGNYQLSPDSVRERGYSAFVEWAPKERLALGASSLVTHDAHDLQLQTALWRHAHGVFARWSPRERLALLAEADYVLFSQPPGSNNSGVALMLMADYEILRGFHAMLTWEGLAQDLTHGNAFFSSGMWTGLVWFLASHVDVRFDVVWRNNGQSSPRTNDTMLLGQLHLFL
jgi:hypothetical protein